MGELKTDHVLTETWNERFWWSVWTNTNVGIFNLGSDLRCENVNLNQFSVIIGFVLMIFSKRVKLFNGNRGGSIFEIWYLEPKRLIYVTSVCLEKWYYVVAQLGVFFVDSRNLTQIDRSRCDFSRTRIKLFLVA